jgi:hypothetical protein
MKNKAIIGLCTAGMLLSVGLLMGANPGPRAAAHWEYGIFLQSVDGFRWEHEGQLVEGNTAEAFIHDMGLPKDTPTGARKNALQRAVFDYLGARGWELVQVVHNDDMPTTHQGPGTYHYAYWFKRPK